MAVQPDLDQGYNKAFMIARRKRVPAYISKVKHAAQGWYRDPYGLHQDRYFSDGHPTKLVRDDGAESYAAVPDGPPPVAELISAEPRDIPDNGSDLLRVDADDDRYSGRAAGRGVFDSVAGSWPPQ